MDQHNYIFSVSLIFLKMQTQEYILAAVSGNREHKTREGVLAIFLFGYKGGPPGII